MADKSFAVESKNPWNSLADFNSDLSNIHARQRVKSEKSNWRREGDSNAIYTALLLKVTDRDSRSQVVTFAFVFNSIFSFKLPLFSDGL